MYEDLLREAPLFQELSHRELTWLGDACRGRDYAAGDALVRKEHANGVGLFMVTSGSVRVVGRHENAGVERDVESSLGEARFWGN
jgi:signal-transduction protein with cAMP-binding, CBS, and nucleotidyltransferase domain